MQIYEEFSIKNDYYPDNIVFSSANNYLALSLMQITSHSEGTTNPSNLSMTGSCVEVY